MTVSGAAMEPGKVEVAEPGSDGKSILAYSTVIE